MGAKEARACHGSGGLRNFVTITDPVRNFSHAVELIQTGSYDAQGQLTNELLQLLIKLCQWRHMHSVQVRACNRSAALHRGRFAPMCSANHRQLKMRPHRLTIRLLVYVNYRDRVLFRDPMRFAGEEGFWNCGKTDGAEHVGKRMSRSGVAVCDAVIPSTLGLCVEVGSSSKASNRARLRRLGNRPSALSAPR
jgi:hypothetical protein